MTRLARGFLLLAAVVSIVVSGGAYTPGAAQDVRPGSTIILVGALPLDPVPFFVDAYRNLAIVGNDIFPEAGDVYLVDISDPDHPALAGKVQGLPGGGASKPQAVRIGNRDVLVANYQAPSPTGIQLVDITNPTDPRPLSFFDVGSVGVHEMDLTLTPTGRTLALLAVPDREVVGPRIDGERIGDFIIVDISDPEDPFLAGEWGVIDEFGLTFFEGVQQGQNPRAFGHSVWAHPDGTHALLSYKDAGVFIIDISDPASPILVGRTTYPEGAEGEASFAVQHGGILIQGDEDYFSFGVFVTAGDLAGRRSAVEARFSGTVIYSLPGHAFAGDVIDVGRGCPGDAYPDAAGRVALIERSSACRRDHQVARAQLAGAIGAIIYNAAPSSGLPSAGENLFQMTGSSRVTIANVDGQPVVVSISIPAVGVQRGTGFALRDSATQAKVNAEFNGWGFLRFYDVSDPANPFMIGTFVPEHLRVENVVASGIPLSRIDSTRTVHNPQVRGQHVYAPWRSDGLRIVDFTNPSAPFESAVWMGEGAPLGATGAVWSVDLYRNLILAVDLDFGLYVLKLRR